MDDGCLSGGEGGEGLRRGDLVGWYLRETEADIDSEAELVQKKVLVEKVIFRLVHHVSCSRLAEWLGAGSGGRGAGGRDLARI